MRLLVTGATGHVGARIVEAAARRGLDVVAVHRGERRALAPEREATKIEWAPCDLDDAAQVEGLVESRHIDACIHAAAVSNEAMARPAPLRAVATNVGATANLLDAARRRGWRRFVLVGTGSVFQKRADTTSPIPEDGLPEPEDIYSTTKTSAEMLCRMYRTVFGLSASTVRISWVYGPPVIALGPTRGPIPSYLTRALRGETVREPGGDFAASFTFVEDVAGGLLAAAEATELRFDVYHLGPGVNFSAREVAAAVRAAVPTAELELGPGTEPWTRFTAMRGPLAGHRLREDTGFEPGFTLEAGIAAYAEWMRVHPEAWRGDDGRA